MEWQDYVAQLLSQKSSFDGISLSFEDNAHSVAYLLLSVSYTHLTLPTIGLV